MAKYKVLSMGTLGGGQPDKERKELSRVPGEVEVVQARCANEDELIAVAKDVDVILGGGRLFSRRVFESLPKLRAVMTYSVGFDGIDVDAATDNGIIIVNNPAVAWCVEEVSNHALALLLASAKKLTILNNLVKQGRWGETRSVMTPMPSLFGQTLGIVGCGNIGRMTAEKASVFGLRLLGYDPYVDKTLTAQYDITLVSLTKLLRESDFVSLHTPLDKQTRHLIGEAELKLMKPTAYLINTSRGPVIDEPALIKALQNKQIAGAGMDVFEKEPVDPANPLLKMDNVIVMPHSASVSEEALEVQAVNPSQEARRVLSGFWPKNPVNKEVKPKVKLEQED